MGLRRSYKPINLIVNSNFANGTAGWSAPALSTFSATNGIATFLASAMWGNTKCTSSLFNARAGDKIYLAGLFKGESIFPRIYYFSSSGNAWGTFGCSGANVWERLSAIITCPALEAGYPIVAIQDNRSSGWTPGYFANLMGINLTVLFGAGNEPTQAKCDVWFNNWFEGAMAKDRVGRLGGLR